MATLEAELAKINATAIILTGGKSSRMGRPKALLPFDGRTMIEHIAQTFSRLFSEIVIVASPDQELPSLSATLVRDEISYQGPAAGIYYGLRAASQDVAFVISCDVPFINLSFVSYLMSQIPDYEVVVPYWDGRYQPLHAVHRRSVWPLLQKQLEGGDHRPISLYKMVRTREIHEDEIRRFDPEGLSFLNMNTWEEYNAALIRWQERAGADKDSAGAVDSESISNSLITCTVELFSVARLVAKTPKVSLDLPPEATLSLVFSTLADKLPALVGPVITRDKNGLTGGNTCNINGRQFVRDPSVKVHPGDEIFIISSDAGG